MGWKLNKKRQHRRRCRKHDYYAPWIYMITLMKNPVLPVFSEIRGSLSMKENSISAVNNSFGEAIKEGIYLFKSRYYGIVDLQNFVIMPDHVHLILWVKKKLNKHLGEYISELKGLCTQRVRILLEPDPIKNAREIEIKENIPAFEGGYNDRILLRKGQLLTMRKYIADNPRRLYIKRCNPDLFFNRRILEIKGGEENERGENERGENERGEKDNNGENKGENRRKEYDVMGNIFLLRDFDKMAVKVRSKWSDKEFILRKNNWLDCVAEGGVIISPFISSREKIVRDEAMELEGNIIYLWDKGLPEKPQLGNKIFDYLATGHLLLISPKDNRGKAPKISGGICSDYNKLAEMLAEMDLGEIILKKASF